MVNVFSVVGAALSLLAPFAVADPAYCDPPAERLTVQIVTVSGSGCPQGTSAISMSPDNTRFIVTNSAYIALAGLGARPLDSRKNCFLTVMIAPPSGYTYAVSRVEYQGYAHLEAGATARERGDFFFQGTRAAGYVSHEFVGPMDDEFFWDAPVDPSALTWLPCGEQRYLNLATELRVAVGTSDPTSTTSYITMDSTGWVFTGYHLVWSKCSPA